MDLKSIGVTTQKENQFAARGINSLEDLAAYLPKKYKDFTHLTGVRPADEVSCVILRVERVQAYYRKTPMLMAFCTLACDANGLPVPEQVHVHVQWFNQTWMHNRLAAR